MDVEFEDRHACCVIVASDGYPLKYEKGYEITIPDDVKPNVYVAGAALKDGKLVNAGGRVLGVVGKGNTLKEAIDTAYKMTEKVHFQNAYYRKDIGKRALQAGGEK